MQKLSLALISFLILVDRTSVEFCLVLVQFFSRRTNHVLHYFFFLCLLSKRPKGEQREGFSMDLTLELCHAALLFIYSGHGNTLSSILCECLVCRTCESCPGVCICFRNLGWDPKCRNNCTVETWWHETQAENDSRLSRRPVQQKALWGSISDEFVNPNDSPSARGHISKVRTKLLWTHSGTRK